MRRVGQGRRKRRAHLRKHDGHAEPVIGRAFAQPVGFARPTKLRSFLAAFADRG